jgi:AcrR family transcriptional regulator
MTERPDLTPLTARQEDLLQETLQLVREVGLGGVTVRRVAERMGFSEAALYRHFPSKSDLLVALVQRMGGQLLEPVRKLAADPARSLEERLEAILRHHVRLIVEVEGLPMLLLAEAAAAGDEALLGQMRKVVGELMAIEEELLCALPPERLPAAPKDLVLLLFGLPAAIAFRLKVFPGVTIGAAEAGELAEVLVRRLLDPHLGDDDAEATR